MSENINNLRRGEEVRKTLIEKRVSENTIGTLEKAIENGLVFRTAADLAILNLPLADVQILETAVDYGAPAPEANVQTLEYRRGAAPHEREPQRTMQARDLLQEPGLLPQEFRVKGRTKPAKREFRNQLRARFQD